MTASPISIALTQANFQQTVAEGSRQRLVMVNIWTEQHPACQSLTPILEKLASEYGPRLLLATVDYQREPVVADLFRPQALPTVVLIKNGQVVDGFAGAQPESTIRQLLEKHLPKAEDEWLAAAREALAANDAGSAMPLLRQAHDKAPQRADIQLALADCLLRLGRTEGAAELLANIRMADHNGYYKELMAQLELKQQAANTPEIRALEQQLAASPDDASLRYQLALQYHLVGRTEEALTLLFALVQRDRQALEGSAHSALLDILRTLPAGDPLAASFRRKLYSLLY